jgi:hypothetical protein
MRTFRLSILCLGLAAILPGCDNFPSPAPVLISPGDETEFDSLPPTFVWSKEEVKEYYLTVFKDSLWSNNILIWDTLENTTFAMSKTDLASTDSGRYVWTVFVKDTLTGRTMYQSPHNFRIKRFLFPLDLDTTYFPLGLGYEWIYQRHDLENDSYDTLTVTVTGLEKISDTLVFTLSGQMLDINSPTEVFECKIELWVWAWDMGKHYILPVVAPRPFHKEESYSLETITYEGDTLVIDVISDEREISRGLAETWTRRVRGLGIVKQGSSFVTEFIPDLLDYTDSLIRFTTPQGQVWP